MKKTILTFFIFFFLISFSFAQDFVPGYYIINSDAQFAVAIPSGRDNYVDGNGCMHQIESFTMRSGEVVIAFQLFKGKYFCFDPFGRMVVFQGQNCLSKAPITDGSGVGLMKEQIQFVDGNSLDIGSYYWIVGQDIAKSTVKIQIGNNKQLDIPDGKIELFGTYEKEFIKNQTFINVED